MLNELKTLQEIQGLAGEIRAGGTDVHDRFRAGISGGSIIDISRLPDLDQIEQGPDGTTTLGALTKIDTVGNHDVITKHYGALAKAANGLATPQIRWMASLGGNLLQRTRCPYYRHPDLPCLKKGDQECGGRQGVHTGGVIFDQGGCCYPHASTLATALLAYEAEVLTSQRGPLPIADLYSDGTEHHRDHLLVPGELLTHMILPATSADEQTAYFRSISRFEAEWPIVECSVRLLVKDNTIHLARIGVGGVAQIPLRLNKVEAALEGQVPSATVLQKAAEVAVEGANPLPQAAWKVEFLKGTLLSALEMALDMKG